jgi:hypothetical protein
MCDRWAAMVILQAMCTFGLNVYPLVGHFTIVFCFLVVHFVMLKM